MKKTMDTYIAGFPPGTRKLLKRFIYFAGWKNHVSIYPVTRGIERVLKREIDPYRGGKGTLRFPLGAPLPMRLIRKIVATRATELRGS